MTKRKVLLTLLLILLSFAATSMMGIVPLNAEQTGNTEASLNPSRYTSELKHDPSAQALMLYKLGFITKSDKDLEPDRILTRVDAAVMLVRILGGESEVQAARYTHPFTDVPAWASNYVGWLYKKGLVHGISKTKYGSWNKATHKEFVLALSSAAKGNDDWESYGIATQEEMTQWQNEASFTNRFAIELLARALVLPFSGKASEYETLAQFLKDKGLFTEAQLFDAAWNVLPSNYDIGDDEGFLYHSIAGVTVNKTKTGEFHLKVGESTNKPYFYAEAKNAGSLVLFRIDKKSLECTPVISRPWNEGGWINYSYAITLGERDYLFEYSYGENSARLIFIEGTKSGEVLAGLDSAWLGGKALLSGASFFAAEDALLIAGQNAYYRVDEKGAASFNYEQGTQVSGFDGIHAVVWKATPQNTTVSMIRTTDGAVIDSYTTIQDTLEEWEFKAVAYKQNNLYCGEAGLYAVEDGRLKQITARPALDVAFFINKAGYVILTHDPAKRFYSANGFGGDEIVFIEDDGREITLLSNTVRHDISIRGFTEESSEDTVYFYSAQDQGMQKFSYFYYSLQVNYNREKEAYEKPSLIVTDFVAGRPEVESSGYVRYYINAEQERINRLEYGILRDH